MVAANGSELLSLSENCSQPKDAALPKVITPPRTACIQCLSKQDPLPQGCSQIRSSAWTGGNLCCHCTTVYLHGFTNPAFFTLLQVVFMRAPGIHLLHVYLCLRICSQGGQSYRFPLILATQGATSTPWVHSLQAGTVPSHPKTTSVLLRDEACFKLLIPRTYAPSQ